jgi:hypothetical protein
MRRITDLSAALIVSLLFVTWECINKCTEGGSFSLFEPNTEKGDDLPDLIPSHERFISNLSAVYGERLANQPLQSIAIAVPPRTQDTCQAYNFLFEFNIAANR